MLHILLIHWNRHLMGTERVLIRNTIPLLWTRPALRERKTNIGQTGRVRSLLSRAFFWIASILSTMVSSTLAISGCIRSGFSPSTKNGSQPIPLKYEVISSLDWRDRIVGLLILKPFKCKIGRTAPSVTGLMNRLENHEAANGPVSASPSPITTAEIKSGLSRIAPTPWDRE